MRKFVVILACTVPGHEWMRLREVDGHDNQQVGPELLVGNVTHTGKLYPRQCSTTGRGMYDGFCFGDGCSYLITGNNPVEKLLCEELVTLWVKEALPEEVKDLREELEREPTNDEIRELGVEHELYYWTEWDEVASEAEEGDVWYTYEGFEYVKLDDGTWEYTGEIHSVGEIIELKF